MSITSFYLSGGGLGGWVENVTHNNDDGGGESQRKLVKA